MIENSPNVMPRSAMRLMTDVREQLRLNINSLKIPFNLSESAPAAPIDDEGKIHTLGILDGILVSSLYPNLARVCSH